MAMTPEEKKTARYWAQRRWRESHAEKHREDTKRWAKAHPENGRARSRKYRETHLEQARSAESKWRKANLEKIRAWNRKYLYGVMPKVYEQMLVEQRGVCAICGGNRGKHELGVDHNHISGDVRGLLCKKCNLAVGYMDDNPEWLRSAANYLEETSRNTSLTPDT
jgi:hypothetical protein